MYLVQAVLLLITDVDVVSDAISDIVDRGISYIPYYRGRIACTVI